MNTTSRAETPPALLFGRHIVGMALVALLNPLIYYSNEPVAKWFSIWAGAIAFALACFGLYALFFTARAKEAWPKSFFTLAWVFVVLITMEPYINGFNKRQSAVATPQQQPTSQAGWDRGTYSAPASEVDAFLAAPPSAEEARRWTQVSTGASANEPWLKHAPNGSRFCRLQDGVVVVLFPPGLRPQAAPADVRCVTSSVESPGKLGFTYEEATKPAERWKEGIPIEMAKWF